LNPPCNDSRSDQQLIAAINSGDLGAFDAVYWRYRDWVVRLAGRYSGNADDALDVLQEAFAYFYRKFPGFVLTARLSTFFYPVVKNLALAARRKRGRFTSDAQSLEQVPDAHATDPAGADLSDILAHMSDIHREVLLMRFVEGMTLDEIARALRIPTGTAKSRLHNAIAALRGDPRLLALWG
jgi:RNA polymerase sigma-70 factor, ECF subfamily